MSEKTTATPAVEYGASGDKGRSGYRSFTNALALSRLSLPDGIGLPPKTKIVKTKNVTAIRQPSQFHSSRGRLAAAEDGSGVGTLGTRSPVTAKAPTRRNEVEPGCIAFRHYIAPVGDPLSRGFA